MRYIISCVFGCLVSLIVGSGLLYPQNPRDPYAEHIAATGPRTPEEERKTFHVPPGFEVELVAAEPYVRKPININFDDRGRLWVTESIEYPFAAAANARHRDTVRILGDSHGNGQIDEVTTFADDLNIPIGVLPVTGGAIVYSIPAIYRLTDVDGDDRADKREKLFGTYGHKDTHGMTGEFTWGFDGWVYACHGFSNTSKVTAADGSTITMTSGNTYRFKPDGSHVEYFTHGQVNPFGLSLDPLGNLYSCDCHSRPIYQLLRGAWYPSFGAPHDGLGFGPEMMSHDHGSTAIAGITYYAADHFPPEYRDTVFIGNVVTNRINHDRLEKHGSTLIAVQQPDFLSCNDNWFRPVDIKLGPDGALYVADFYNRIIGHYEVPLTHPGRDRERGRIWRIVYRGPDGKGAKPRRPRADWARASVPELLADLGHPNLTVRIKAMNQLVERGAPAATPTRKLLVSTSSTPWQRAHALWVLERVGKLDAYLAFAAHQREPLVRVHAMRVLTERKTWDRRLEEGLALQGLTDSDPFVQRTAADALGRHPAPHYVRPLLDLEHRVPADDTHLLHVVRMALRDTLQMQSDWTSYLGARWSEYDVRAIADVATGAPTPAAADFLLRYLQRWPETKANQVRYVYHIARYGQGSSGEALLAFAKGDRAAELTHHLALFHAMRDGLQARGASVDPATRAWAEDLTRQLIASPVEAEYLAGIELGGSLRTDTIGALLTGPVTDKKVNELQRITAMTALMAIDRNRYIGIVGAILGDSAESVPLRERAAQLLAGTKQPEAHVELLKALAAAPERLALPIAIALADSREGAEKLLEAVAAGKASARLLQERAIGLRLERLQLPHWKDRLARLTRDLPPADQRYTELLNRRRAGFAAARTDLALGSKVFEKNCATCHQLANKGAKIGPQLDGVGIRGFDRLLEDIVDPNRNVDQAFRATTLSLKNGQLVTGLVLREEGQVLVLADSQGKEVRVPKDSVEERTVSQLSPMPANLVDQIPEADFYHLLAYLLAQRPNK
jgi:putative heme-binding domain-containing protein